MTDSTKWISDADMERWVKAEARLHRITKFVRESNTIEGIHREPTTWEITAHDELLMLDRLDSRALEEFVACVQPGAKIRTQVGMNVRVGSYVPPAGNPNMRKDLDAILTAAYEEPFTPYEIHCRYQRAAPLHGRQRTLRTCDLGMAHAPCRAGPVRPPVLASLLLPIARRIEGLTWIPNIPR